MPLSLYQATHRRLKIVKGRTFMIRAALFMMNIESSVLSCSVHKKWHQIRTSLSTVIIYGPSSRILFEQRIYLLRLTQVSGWLVSRHSTKIHYKVQLKSFKNPSSNTQTMTWKYQNRLIRSYNYSVRTPHCIILTLCSTLSDIFFITFHTYFHHHK